MCLDIGSKSLLSLNLLNVVVIAVITNIMKCFLIRRIRELLYEQGFTISGARNRLMAQMKLKLKQIMEQVNYSVRFRFEYNQVLISIDFDFASVKPELLEILNLLRPEPTA